MGYVSDECLEKASQKNQYLMETEKKVRMR